MKPSILATLWLALITALPPARAEDTNLAATLTVGYDSRYVLYGYRLSRHLWHADLYLYRPLSETTSLWGGGWYGYLTDGTYHEVDGYAGVDHAWTEWLSLGLAYSLFNYIEVPFPASNQAHEIAAHATVAHEGLSLSARSQYDTDADGFLLRAIGGYAHPMSDRWGLALHAEAGYSLRYFVPGNRWNHALVKLSAPVTLTESVSMTVFVARSVPLDAIRDFEEYETYGGVSLSVSR